MLEAAQTISLASHVSVAVAVAFLFGVARLLPPTDSIRRWSIATLAIFSTRLIIVILWSAGIVSLLPMLAGFSSVAAALLMGWPLLFPKPRQRWDSIFIAILIALVLALLAHLAAEMLSAISVPQELWGILGMLFALLILSGLAARRSIRWPLFTAGFGLLSVGFVIDTWIVAGTQQLVELIAYPVMAFSVAGILVTDAKLAEPSSPLADFSGAIRFYESAVGPDLLIFTGLRVITFSLKARYGLVFRGPDPSGMLNLLRSFDSQGIREPSGPPLQAKALPQIVTAMKQERAQVLKSEHELSELGEALSLDPTTQALVSSIPLNGNESGGVMLLSGVDRPHWSELELETFQALIAFLSDRIRKGPRAEERQTEEIETLRGELRLALQELSEVSAVESRDSIARVGTLTSLLSAMGEPVTSILGYSEILRSSTTGGLDSEQIKFLGHIRADAEQLDRQLMELINLIAAPHDAVRSEVEISEIVEVASSQVGTELLQSGSQLKREIPANLPRVKADAHILRRVIVILIERAIRVSPSGSQIHVIAHADDDEWVSIAVADQGPGLPAEDLGKAFQASDGDLPQAKALVDSLGGRLWVGSEMGAGSTVTVVIPISEGTVASAS